MLASLVTNAMINVS